MHLLHFHQKHHTRTNNLYFETVDGKTDGRSMAASYETYMLASERHYRFLFARAFEADSLIRALDEPKNHRVERNQNVWRCSFNLVTCARSRAIYHIGWFYPMEYGRVRTYGPGIEMREGWVWRSAANHRHMPRHEVHEWHANAVYPEWNTWYRHRGEDCLICRVGLGDVYAWYTLSCNPFPSSFLKLHVRTRCSLKKNYTFRLRITEFLNFFFFFFIYSLYK